MSRFTTLYSGSTGNSAVLEHAGKYLLIDMGGSCRATVRALAELGLRTEDLSGILVTHEHSDHIKGLKVFLKKYKTPVFTGAATRVKLRNMEAVPEDCELCVADSAEVIVDGFVVRGFHTSHDAVGCCGFKIKTGDSKSMAIATDLGEVGEVVYANLCGNQLVALESNYDPERLRMGSYPYYLKKRIASTNGHLSNLESAEVIASLSGNGCAKFALCHLSAENNHPKLVEQAMQNAAFYNGIKEIGHLQISKRFDVSPWIEL